MTNPVLDLLTSKNQNYKISGKDYLIKCLNPDHTDTNPSFRIDKITGAAHCFSCGFKTNIFKYYGILGSIRSVKVSKLKQKLRDLTIDFNGLPPIVNSKPFNEPYRNISVKTLRNFEACYTDKVPELEDRIIFPIKDVRNKVTAYVARHTMSDGHPRYLVYPEHSSIELFPYLLEEKVNSIVLVEGIFDFLNLYEHGMRNAVCTFGTTKLITHTAEKLLPFKVLGIGKVFILYDGDEAGKKAAQQIKPLIEEAGFDVEIIDIEEDTDPGEMSPTHIKELIEYTK